MRRLWFALRWGMAIVLATVALAWLAAVAYLYVNQRHILYATKPGHETPHIMGLDIRDVSIRTPDGETLEGWYQPPQAGKPVFLFLHGKGDTLRVGKWRYLRMHAQGVGYLALAYRGYSGSTGTPTEHGLFIDGLAGYDWLKAQGFHDGDIVIHGHSLGSGVATYVATQRPARALILEAPFTAASDVASDHYPFVPSGLLMKDRYLNRERIGKVHMPLLIVHGDRDSVIPFAEGKRLFALANQPKTFVRMAGSDHNTLTRDGAYVYYWRFLGLK